MPPKTKTITTTIVQKPAPNPPQQPQRRRRRRPRRSRASGGSVLSNEYLRTLFLPPLGAAKIPDPSCLLTSSVTQTADYTLTANANNACGLLVFLRSYGGTTLGASTAIQAESASSSDTGFLYDAASFPGGATSFATTFSASRLVSASLEIEFCGSSLNDAGRIQLASYYGTRFVSEAPATTVTGMYSARDNTSMSIREGGFIRWKPADDTCDDFSGTSATNVLGYLHVHVSGASTGAPFRVRVVLNYEALPLSDTISYATATPSPVDDSLYSRARNLISTTSSFDTFNNLSSLLSRGAIGIASLSLLNAYRRGGGGMRRDLQGRTVMDLPD